MRHNWGQTTDIRQADNRRPGTQGADVREVTRPGSPQVGSGQVVRPALRALADQQALDFEELEFPGRDGHGDAEEFAILRVGERSLRGEVPLKRGKSLVESPAERSIGSGAARRVRV
jgi:hypothetical protein